MGSTKAGQLHKLFPDPAIADAVLDRLVHHAAAVSEGRAGEPNLNRFGIERQEQSLPELLDCREPA
jgi:hypothetical protein